MTTIYQHPGGPFFDKLLHSSRPFNPQQPPFPPQSPPNLDGRQVTLLYLNLLTSSLAANVANSSDFANISGDQERVKTKMEENLELINNLNRGLMEKLESIKGRLNPRCREKRLNLDRMTVSKGFLTVQESALDLQSAVSASLLRRDPGREIKILLNSLCDATEEQKERLKILEKEEEEEEEEEEDTESLMSGCQEPFFIVGRQCFYVSFHKKLSWHQASEECQRMGTHLARPKDVRGLVRILQDFPGKYNRVWIGASDEEQEGSWLWNSGQPLDLSDWRHRQPSNRTANYGEQDCLSLVTKNYQGGPTMDDHSCWMNRAFLCEMEMKC